MIPYGRQTISQDDINAVIEVLKSDYLTQGPAVPEFELAFAKAVTSQYALSVCNATSALHLACIALGVGVDDWVWTSPISFVASANCALYCGAKIDFVDIDPDSFNMCATKLEKKLFYAQLHNLPLPKVVIVVHMAGQPCDMKAISKLAKIYQFCVIEDASHGVGAEYQGVPVGSCAYSDICVFSFHPVKIITTGEGGMLTTNDVNLYNTLSLLRSHGITRSPDQLEASDEGPWYYEQQTLGFNYRMTDIQAALGFSQLSKLQGFVKKRNEIAQSYQSALEHKNIQLPQVSAGNVSSWHLYIVRVEADKHLSIFNGLRDKGILVNLHYIPIYKQPYYQGLGFSKQYCLNAEIYYQQAISLPIYPSLSHRDQMFVVEELARLVGE